MDSLVTTEWLNRHLGDPDLVILDCMVRTVETPDGFRTVSGYDDYVAGHIPTAGFADLTGDLRDRESPLDFAFPDPPEFCSVMGNLGVGDASRVVLYDGFLSAWAARVWWMLRWVGFDRAAILDGGLNAWKADGLPLSTEPATHSPKVLTPKPRPGLVADRDEILSAIDDPRVHLIDALPVESYRGEMPLYDRPGHIPTAISIPGMGLLDETGRYRPSNELEKMHGMDPKARAITYCGGGILAASNAFVMTRLGFEDVAVYAASLQEWAADPSTPMTVEPSGLAPVPK